MLLDLGLTTEGRSTLGQIMRKDEGVSETLRLKAAQSFHRGSQREFIAFLGHQPLEASSREIGIAALKKGLNQEALKFLTSNLVPGKQAPSQRALLAIAAGAGDYERSFPFSVRAAEAVNVIIGYLDREALGLPLSGASAAIVPSSSATQHFDRESLRAAAVGAVAALTRGNDRLLAALAILQRDASAANFVAVEILKERGSPELPQVIETLLTETKSPRELTKLLEQFSVIGLDSPEIEQRFMDRHAQYLGARIVAALESVQVPYSGWARRMLFGALEEGFIAMREARDRREEERLFWSTTGSAR
jgi:hypothetical protein